MGLYMKFMKLEEKLLVRFFCSSIVILHICYADVSWAVFEHHFQMEPSRRNAALVSAMHYEPLLPALVIISYLVLLGLGIHFKVV